MSPTPPAVRRWAGSAACSASQIGLLGLAGLAGALGAWRAGAVHDRGWSAPAMGIALALLGLSLVATWAARSDRLPPALSGRSTAGQRSWAKVSL